MAVSLVTEKARAFVVPVVVIIIKIYSIAISFPKLFLMIFLLI